MLKSLFTPTMLKNYLSCSYIVHNEKYHEKLGIVRNYISDESN